MNKEQAIIQSNIHSNLLFVLTDVMETLLMDTNSLLKASNREFKQDTKRNFNTSLKALRLIKSPVSSLPDKTQCNFGNDSDMLYQMIKLIIDRCGASDEKMFQFFNYVHAFPSQLGVDIDSSVFNFIGRKEVDK